MKLSKSLRDKASNYEYHTEEYDFYTELANEATHLEVAAKMANDYLTKYGPHGVTDMPQHLAVVEVLRVALLNKE